MPTDNSIVAGLKTPSSVLGLTRNLCTALHEGLLLIEELYHDENLLRFSGGRMVLWSDRRVCNEQAMVTGFSDIAPDFDVNGTIYESIGLDLGRNLDRRTNQAASLLVLFRTPDAALSFDTVIGIFGSDWVPAPGRFPPSGRIWLPVTNKHGYEEIQYKRCNRTFELDIRMNFGPNGDLQEMTAELEAL